MINRKQGKRQKEVDSSQRSAISSQHKEKRLMLSFLLKADR
jgi:hypothetical protein